MGLKRTNPKFASIFSGCGGFDLGFVRAGFTCEMALDIDPSAIDVHRKNLKSPAFVCDLSNGHVPLETLSDLDVLLAGSPCQGFSTAGRRKFDDPRNQLLLTAGNIATLVRPKVFIAENVAGVTAMPHSYYWDSLILMLREAGYRTASLICRATQMGVPQIRKRALIIAWNTGAETEISLPYVCGGTLRSALSNVVGTLNHQPKPLPSDGDLYKVATRIKQGQKLSNVRGGPRAVHTWQIPEVFGRTTEVERTVLETLMRMRRRHRMRVIGDADPVSERRLSTELGYSVSSPLKRLIGKGYVRRAGRRYDLSHTFNGKFRRLYLDLPSLTVDTRFGNPRYFLHPTQQRGFTVREAARIQGFPDSFVFSGSESSQFRLIGNAVPPPLARGLASFVIEAFLH